MIKDSTESNPICNNKHRSEKESFENLKSELVSAFSVSDSSYFKLKAKDIFNRNKMI